MDNSDSIDIVIPWVDSGDPAWQAEKRKYDGSVNSEDDAREIRYRDWNNLKYLFRSIEKCAPWVRKVHFVTCGQTPDWMNVSNPKLHLVNHRDYIPEEYLPTFNSHVIELNMHRIPDLSEKFIYFNDDTFLLRPVKSADFFRDGLPCDSNISNLVVPCRTNFFPIVFNTVSYINQHFNKRENIKRHLGQYLNVKYGFKGIVSFFLFLRWEEYTGFHNPHMPSPFLKRTLETVWEAEPEIMEETSSHKFRNNNDVNQYIFRYWQLASGNFHPYTLPGRFFKVSDNNQRMLRYMRERKGRMICVNDGEFQRDFETVKREINAEFERLYPDKSGFEA